MAEGVEAIVRTEVEALHAFFVGWFSGMLDRSEYAAGFLSRFDPDFLLVPPGGQLLTLEAFAESVRAAHATNPDFRIEIRNVKLRRTFEGHVLATYEEWQRNALASKPRDNARIATVVFRDARPLRWLHVHETGLPDAIARAGPYDF